MIRLSKSKLPNGFIIKKEEDYRTDPIFSTLRTDCYDKCYICEDKATANQVEHWKAVRIYKNRKFDWDNLFLACAHCNLIKGDEYTNLIDCTREDPESLIDLSIVLIPDSPVTVTAKDACRGDILETVELLNRVYNDVERPTRALNSTNLKEKIIDGMLGLVNDIDKYKKLEQAENAQELVFDLECKIAYRLSRRAPFSAFMRGYIRRGSKWAMDRFGKYLD